MRVANLVLPTCLPVIIFSIILKLFYSRMLSRLVACEILVAECMCSSSFRRLSQYCKIAKILNDQFLLFEDILEVICMC
jgi:hypothetical protein